MIARMWFGRSTLEKAGDYVEHLRTTVFPELRQIEGFSGAYILRGIKEDSVEFSVLTLWTSMEAVKKFAGESPEIAVVPPEAQALLTEFDSTVSHYEVVVGPSELTQGDKNR